MYSADISATSATAESLDHSESSNIYTDGDVSGADSAIQDAGREEPLVDHPRRQQYGYFPSFPGQELDNGKYEIVRKLGWGSCASVWLARMPNTAAAPSRYVAIKVLNATTTRLETHGLYSELKMVRNFMDVLRDTTSTARQHPGFEHCVMPHCYFTITPTPAYDRSHHCIVYPVAHASVSDLQKGQPGGRLPLTVVKSITRQTLLALSFLHDVLRMVHCDLKPSNLLVKLEVNDRVLEDYLRQHPVEILPPQESSSGSGTLSQSIISVKSQPLLDPTLRPPLEHMTICLSDYGSAADADIDHDETAQTPLILLAPEQLLFLNWSRPIDIWAVGCMVIKCLTGVDPFERGSDEHIDCKHIARIYDMLGPFPANVLQANADYAKCFFDERGVPLEPLPTPRPPFEQWLCGFDCIRREMHPQDASLTARFLRRCLAIDAARRPTARELLRDVWLSS